MMEVMSFPQPSFGFRLNDQTMSYGMSAHQQPARRSLQETVKETTRTCSTEVMETDVLCGRDKTSHAHIGNKRFRHIVMLHREEYQSAPSRELKTNITCKIVSMVKECGGRFLKQDEKTGEWTDVGEHYAREKVSHALRSAKDPKRPKTKKRREVKKYVPTPEEDSLFEATLADQQRIFQRLVAREASGDTSEVNLDDLDNLLSGI